MPVKLRLARHGRKKFAFYHIVAADGRAPRDGRFIEKLGIYDPNTNPATIELDFEKSLDWLQKGAQPTETVRAILSYKGVLMKRHLLEGVRKGAFSEEEAEKRFAAWLKEKEGKIQAKIDRLARAGEDAIMKKLEAETKVSEARAAEIMKRREALEEAEEKERAETDAEAEKTVEPEAEPAAAEATEPETEPEEVEPEAEPAAAEATEPEAEPDAKAEENASGENAEVGKETAAGEAEPEAGVEETLAEAPPAGEGTVEPEAAVAEKPEEEGKEAGKTSAGKKAEPPKEEGKEPA